MASALPAPTLNERQFVLTEGEYLDRMHYMLQTEVLILRASGFQTSIALPHCLALNYIRTLDGHISPLIHQLASETIAHLNTALLSPQLLYLTNQPNALAAAAVYLGAREVGVKLPELPWWEVFDVDREQLGFLVVAMLSMDAFAESIQKSSSSKRPLPW